MCDATSAKPTGFPADLVFRRAWLAWLLSSESPEFRLLSPDDAVARVKEARQRHAAGTRASAELRGALEAVDAQNDDTLERALAMV